MAVIGSNGAGKTTLFRAVCGLLRRSSGHGSLRRPRHHRLSAHRIARLGLAYVPPSATCSPR